MPITTMKTLVEAGVHFGSRTARWDPRMAPYIHSKNNGIHIIDLRETLKGLIRTHHFLLQITAQGKQPLFVGTKRQAAPLVKEEARRCQSYYVSNRWLGGTLTNMRTMRERVVRLEELEGLEKTGEIQDFSKKMIASLTREKRKIERNFEGIRNMTDLPGAMIIVDPKQEDIAIAEAEKLGIPVIAITDTDCDPTPVDFVIPANDDAHRSIACLLHILAESVLEGKRRASTGAAIAKRRAEGKPGAEADEGPDTVLEDIESKGSFSYGGDGEE